MKKFLIILIMSCFLSVSAMAGEEEDALSCLCQELVGSKTRANYDWAVNFAYTANTGPWVTGIAIYNFSGSVNELMIGYWNAQGDVCGKGFITLQPYALYMGFPRDVVTIGTAPALGSMAIFGTGLFIADKFVNNGTGGFGEVEKQAIFF